MSRAGRPSARRAALRDALTGMDGEPRLRVAIDAIRREVASDADVVMVNNGARGPNVIDARAIELGGWLVEGLIPAGAIAALADLDDPSPSTLLAAGFDVVLRLHARGEMTGGPVLLSCHWRRGLVPGCEPPEPSWIRQGPEGFVNVDTGEAA